MQLLLSRALQPLHVFHEEKGIYSEDNVPEPVYDGLSDEETNEDYHQDMDDDCAHYVRSP